jgi:transposase-like protein
VEPVHRAVLGVYISRHRNTLVAESFLESLVHLYGKHVVYSDSGAWYPDACRSLKLEHRLHTPYEKSIVERVVQYLKDRVEGFDDYFPCMKQEYDLSHAYNWVAVFVFLHNGIVRSHIRFRLLAHIMS